MDEKEERGYKQYDGLWGEQLSQMKNRLVYRRGGKSVCVYCGELANTREHCPPKFLLTHPYPPNLSELPACYECNNSFSSMEEKVKELITEITEIELREGNATEKWCKGDVAMIYKEKKLPDYLTKVLAKIARGHAVYKLGDAFGDSDYNSFSAEVVLKSFVGERDWQNMNLPVVIEKLPELGSRCIEDSFVIEYINDKSTVINKQILIDWTISQPDIYRFLAFYQEDRIIVRMVIRECFWVQVSISEINIV